MTKTYEEYSKFHFSIADYCVFAGTLILSTGIGIYIAYLKEEHIKSSEGRESSKEPDFGSKAMGEYLLGSRRLKVFPVAMSLIASYISGVTMLGVPSEIYNYGTQYSLIFVSIMLHALVVAKVYLPVFTKLKVGSSYEYLEMRFSSSVRSITSFMFILDQLFFMPMILYVPAIAFNQVSGINLHIISVTMTVVCVIYTMLGGIKAVVHTDAWQIFVMFIAVFIVVILGTIFAGGPGPVFKQASEGGRIIFFNTNPSLYERQSLWCVLIGGFFYWTSFNSVNQTMVQRYMSLSTIKKAEQSIAIFTLGIVLFYLFVCFSGLLVYHFYCNCDPINAGLIKHDDQLLPIYVTQFKYLPGIPGLFIAGVFGAALSSLSVSLNSAALVLMQDIVRGTFKLNLTERTSHILVKSSVAVFGIVAMGSVFILEKLTGIFGVATSVTAIGASTTFGMFTLGMLIPWSNAKGTLVGAVAGALMSGWVAFGSQAVSAAGLIGPHKLNVSVSECLANATIIDKDYPGETTVFPLYRLSFQWIIVIGISSTMLVGTLASFLTGPTEVKKLDADLISPVIHRFLPKECFSRE